MNNVTRILSAIERGDPSAAGQLLPLIYAELRTLAAQKLAREKPGQSLQATALVHEAYLRLVGNGAERGWTGRGHFAGLTGEAAAEILGISATTADRYWTYALAWLRREMDGSGPNEEIEKTLDAGDDHSSH
jgi:DNA-directed RNA polymerase specialized sigma24 family protein